jgi:hypothetical protein
LRTTAPQKSRCPNFGNAKDTLPSNATLFANFSAAMADAA